MELQKAAGEVEISQLKQQVHEQEALLVERQTQLEKLEGEVETRQKTIDDLIFQKSQLEHDVHQYRTKLEIAVKDRAAGEQELSHTKQLIEQSEAKWSLAQKKLEDLLKQTNDSQDLMKQSPKLQRKIKVEEDTEEELESQVEAKEDDLAQGPLANDSQLTVDSEPQSSAVRELVEEVDVLKQKLEELVMVQERAEMAEEKAQSYKKLLDDSNNRLTKVQMEMETERINMRQKSEDLQQETQTMKKSINELQEEIRSLQRAKSSLEQNMFFHNTEVEGLKEQLRISQGELLKKSSMEQDNIFKLNNLEEDVASKQSVIDQLKFKCDELTRVNVLSDSDIRGLQIHTESLEKERSFSEQKIKSLKSEIESWKQQLQTAKEEHTLMKRSEQASQLKCKNLEAEIQKSELVASQLQKEVDELKQINMEVEKNLRNARAKLDQVTMEMDSKDQQIKIFKCQVEGTKSQVRIIEEELNKRTQTSHELQIKLQDYSEEVRKMTELQQKNKTLNSNIEYDQREITTLKSELRSAFAEKNLADQKVHMQNAEINNLNVMLKTKHAELQKESAEIKKHLDKVNALEDELFKCKQNITVLTSSSEKITGNLKLEIHALQNDKKAADKNAENLNVKLSELSSSLQRAKDELAKDTREKNVKESKIRQLETELQKNKVTMKEVMSSSDKSRSNLQHENTILKREKAEAMEKSISLGSEIRMLKEKLQRAQTEAEQKQKENAVLKVRSQQMEEQLEKCKKMLEELKRKLELQKEGYEKQLLLVGPKQQMDQQLQIKMDKLQQEKTKLGQELSKTKSQNAQLEEDKLKLNSKISALQSLCNEQSKDITKFKQLLTESEWKLTLKENEARSLHEQIESYIKEVKSLQEKLLTQGFRKTENQKMNKQEISESSRQYVKDSEAALLKTEVRVMQKVMPSYENAKCSMEDEILKMKGSSEITTTEKENILEGLKVKQNKMEVIHSQGLQLDSPTKKTLNSSTYQAHMLLQKDKSQIKPDEFMTMTTQGYMALCGLTEKIPNEKHSFSKTGTHQITETCETENTSERSTTDRGGNLSVIYSTSLKLTDLKSSTNIQNLIKFKLLDEEILRKLEMGLITMEEVQASLAQYVSKPTAIAGVYVESSKEKISFLEAAEKGFLAKTYALEFLETQAATGSLTDLGTGKTYSVLEALERGIIETGMKDKLLEAEKAVSGYIHAGKKLSVFQAIEERILDRFKGKKILEVQVATGGLINPEIGVRVPASIAVDQGLLNRETLQSLYDPTSNPKGFHNPDTGQKAYYSEILRTCLFDIDGSVFLFPFGDRHLTNTSPTSSHRVSVVSSSCGIEMSAYEAFKGKLIDKRTYLFLSQQECDWQEKSIVDTSGSPRHIITDVKSGRQLCLESALSQRFLEISELESYSSGLLSIYEIADIIFSRMVVVEDVNSPIAGLWDITQRKRLSVLQGIQQGFTDRDTALRLLEAQACTGGICDPSSGEKVTVTNALKRGLLDEALAQKLQQFEQAFNGISHPKTAKTLSIPQAVQECLFPKDAGFRCIEFQLLTGGFINPDTHDRVSLEEVIQSGLVDKATASVLKDEKFQSKSLTCPKTKRRITFREALERSVYDCHTGLRLLEATKVHGFGFHYVWAYKQ
ncbi:desmoplakin-like [Thunnus albacares]|uniref:desmoplakin-like n=1 Tax=Thunnus albacares TaxID=8236 RepID=UPI001CF61784|nr:desmoplakin-like [Thunnus albacares]